MNDDLENFELDPARMLCIGVKEQSYHLVEEGASHLKWGVEPELQILASTQSLYLFPPKAAIKSCALPGFVSKFKNLEFLHVPATYVQSFSLLTQLPALNSIMVSFTEACNPALKSMNLHWPSVVLPNIKELRFYTEFGADYPPVISGLSHEVLPGLKSLALPLTMADDWFTLLPAFPGITSLQVENVRDFDFFKLAPLTLRKLSILGSKAKLPFEKLASFPRIKKLFLNGLGNVIDCSVFAALPELDNLFIVNSKKWANTDQLLSCAGLKYLKAVNCGHPFDKHLKNLLEKKVGLTVDIKFS